MALKRSYFYSILSFLAVSTLLFGIFFGVIYRRGNFVVHEIPLEIENSSEQSAVLVETIRDRLENKLDQFTQKRIWDVSLSDLQEVLAADDWIRHIRIQRSFPNEVRVGVQVRKPFLIYAASTNSLMPVAEDGRLLTNISRQLFPDLPILRGEDFAKDEALRQAAVELVKALPEKGALSEKNIAEISYDKEDGYSLYLMSSKTTVKLGHDNLPTKLSRVNRVLDYLQSQQLRGRVIDASFSKKVLVRLRKDS